MELLLIRHGETDFNIEKRYIGIMDIGLNSTGKKQALRLKEIIDKEQVDEVYTSDLSRCIETGSLIGFVNKQKPVKNLREMNFGIVEGLTRTEIVNKYPDVMEKWDKDWLNYKLPKGESFLITANRVIGEIEKIKHEDHTNKIAIITHCGCIKLILAHYIMEDLKAFWKFYLDNGSITRLCFDNNYAYLKSLNEK